MKCLYCDAEMEEDSMTCSADQRIDCYECNLGLARINLTGETTHYWLPSDMKLPDEMIRWHRIPTGCLLVMSWEEL